VEMWAGTGVGVGSTLGVPDCWKSLSQMRILSLRRCHGERIEMERAVTLQQVWSTHSSKTRFFATRTIVFPLGVVTVILAPILEIFPLVSCSALGFRIRTLSPIANSLVAAGL
jgi:hypothetical protein